MISSVYWEWELLLLSIKIGIILAVIYDGILIFRMLIGHGRFVESMEDTLFWGVATATLFQLQLNQSNGVLRGFSVLGVGLGMFLYYEIFGKFINQKAEKGISCFKRRLTQNYKLFKIKLCKHSHIFERFRRKHGTEKKLLKEKETK